MPIKVTLHRLENDNDAQRQIVEKACKALQTAVNMPEFKNRLRDAQYPEALFREKSGQIVTKKPTEIAQIILNGIERDQQPGSGGKHDEEIDLAIRLDNIGRPTVGSTIPGRLPFRTAYWFIDQAARRNDSVSPARHFIHEWLHVAGFVHRRNDGKRQDVPYIVGNMVRDLLKSDSLALAEGDRHHEDPDLSLELDGSDDELMVNVNELLDNLPRNKPD